MKKRGERPRPRVGLLGPWSADIVAQFASTFPTVYDWSGRGAPDIDASEVDLVVYLDPPGAAMTLPHRHASRHLVIFGGHPPNFPDSSHLPAIRQSASGGQSFLLPDLRPAVAALRELELVGVDDIRGWTRLATKVVDDQEGFAKGALLMSVVPAGGVLATAFTRASTSTGFAWIPWTTKNYLAWTVAFVEEWAEADREAFVSVLPWREQASWQTEVERNLRARLAALVHARESALAAFEIEAATLEMELASAGTEGDAGLRALLTAQEEPLVRAVAATLRAFGFEVDEMDSVWAPGQMREDLRVRCEAHRGWEALVEVKGFRKSGGGAEDLRKVDRHARRYHDEKGRWPDARWFIVNGQFELPPSLRQAPFASAPDVVRDFGAEDDGLVVWTLDLFRVAVGTEEDRRAARDRLVAGRGRFT